MQLENLKGYVEYQERTCFFSYDDGILTISPADLAEWKENDLEKIFIMNLKKRKRKRKWLDKIVIDGITINSKGVKFFVTDAPSVSRGFKSFEVDYVYMYRLDINNESYDINRNKI